jgi:hypothetical protein
LIFNIWWCEKSLQNPASCHAPFLVPAKTTAFGRATPNIIGFRPRFAGQAKATPSRRGGLEKYIVRPPNREAQ